MEYLKAVLSLTAKAVVLFGLVSKMLELFSDFVCKLSELAGKPMDW